MKTFADKVIAFNRSLAYDAPLPDGVRIMNPFRENPWALAASTDFYRKYYSDAEPRFMLIGINPGRFGAGLTGDPFTDPKRLIERCGIASYGGEPAHEPSSVFVYEVIRQYGGEEKFYQKVYINSICPLGFTTMGKNGKEVNYNYYDKKELLESARPFMLRSMKKQIAFGLRREIAFCLGTGNYYDHARRKNDEHNFFERIVPLEHPRYVVQYKNKRMREYVDKYLDALSAAG